MNLEELSARQREIINFIKQYLAKSGYPPSVREIGQAVGLTSSSTVHAHLAKLEKLGVIRRDPSKPRALELLDRITDKAEQIIGGVKKSGLPVVGTVAAGAPILAEERVETYEEVSSLAGGDSGDFILAVRGDSMIDAGIFEGDHIVVRKQQTARDGEMVVALIGDEATVKTFYHEGDHIRLQPENSRLEPIITKEAAIVGKVVGVMRSL